MHRANRRQRGRHRPDRCDHFGQAGLRHARRLYFSVAGLEKKNFSVWKLATVGELTIRLVTEFNADYPDSKMPGIYRLQTTGMLGSGAPFPQEFVFALRVHFKRRNLDLKGMTTVPITYLGKPM